jgi:glycerol-3-phosphate dehydrogenase
VQIRNLLTGQEQTIEAEQVINAAGAWVGQVAALADASIEILYSKGSLLVTHRLRPPSDGDVLCPGGTVSILGPSSVRLDSPDDIKPTTEEVDHIIDQGSPIVPSLKQCRYIRAFAGVRPKVQPMIVKSAEDLI